MGTVWNQSGHYETFSRDITRLCGQFFFKRFAPPLPPFFSVENFSSPAPPPVLTWKKRKQQIAFRIVSTNIQNTNSATCDSGAVQSVLKPMNERTNHRQRKQGTNDGAERMLVQKSFISDGMTFEPTCANSALAARVLDVSMRQKSQVENHFGTLVDLSRDFKIISLGT